MRINELLSKEMKVTPLKPGEVAKFRLISAGKVDKNRTSESGERLVSCPEVYMLSDKETIYDPFAKKRILIENVVGLRRNPEMSKMQGTSVMSEETKKPIFTRGYLTVTDEENDTYGFLMRSKKCANNPFAPKKTNKVFELVSSKKDIEDATQIEDLRWRAEKIVRNAEWIELKAIAEAFNKSPDSRLHIMTSDLQGIKLELIRMTKIFGKQIIYASDDVKSKKVVQIYECLNFGILIFDESKWFFNNKDKYETIHEIGPEEDRVESLVTFFEKEAATYQKISEALKSIFRAKVSLQNV